MRITKYRTELNENRHNILVKEKSINYSICSSLSSPKAIVDMLNSCFGLNKLAEEYLYMVAIDAKNKPLGVFEVSHGAVNYSVSNPREIFIRLLLAGATSFILAHNHPSGDPTPSSDDLKVTKRIKECGELIGISLLDHIIIGDTYTSLKEIGVI